MAKLIKATTALRNARKIDFNQLALDRVADNIAYQSGAGNTSTVFYVDTEHADFIVTSLRKAGYTVDATFDSYLEYGSVEEHLDANPTGVVRRLLDKMFGKPTVAEVVSDKLLVNEDITRLRVSWAPVTQEVEEAEEA